MNKINLNACFIIISINIFLLSCGDTRIEKLIVGKKRVISIYAENSWEVNRCLYYDVTEVGKIVTPRSFWGTDNGRAKHSFRFVKSSNESLVGVIETTGGNAKLIIIQDFQSKESWPRLKDNEVSYDEKVIEKWQKRFEILKENNPDLPIAPYFNK